MRARGLLIATLLLAVLGGGVWWSNKQKAAEEAKPKTDAATSPKIIAVSDDQIAQLSLKRKDGEATVLKKNASNKWEMVQPKPLRVDAEAVSSVTSTLTNLTGDQVIEEKPASLAPFGLDAPSFELAITKKDGKIQKLLIGDDTPAGGDVYVKLGDDPRVFSMSSASKTSLDKTLQDLRDKRLLTFDSDKLTRVELTAKKQTTEFGKNNQNEWQILKPKPLRADGWQVEELIRRLRDAKMDTAPSAEDQKKAAAAFGSASPVATAKVIDNSGPQTIEIRKSKDDYYARSSAAEGAYKVPNDLGTGLDKGLDDFRNKKLFDFGFSDPTKIEVRQNGGGAVTYAKNGDKWSSGAKQIDTTSLQGFIDKIRDLSAVKFVDSGFGAPGIDITVTAKEGKLVDKVQISKTGNDYFAKRESDPVIYQLDQKAGDDLMKAAKDIKEAAPEKKK